MASSSSLKLVLVSHVSCGLGVCGRVGTGAPRISRGIHRGHVTVHGDGAFVTGSRFRWGFLASGIHGINQPGVDPGVNYHSPRGGGGGGGGARVH